MNIRYFQFDDKVVPIGISQYNVPLTSNHVGLIQMHGFWLFPSFNIQQKVYGAVRVHIEVRHAVPLAQLHLRTQFALSGYCNMKNK